MDGLGYRNWSSNEMDSPSSYGGSSRGGNGSKKGTNNTNTDIYDFEIDHDDDDDDTISSPEPIRKSYYASNNSRDVTKRSNDGSKYNNGSTDSWRANVYGNPSSVSSSVRGSIDTRRKSTDERMNEILEQNKKSSAFNQSISDDNANNIQSDWAIIMEGIYSPETKALMGGINPPYVAPTASVDNSKTIDNNHARSDSSFGDSSFGDSLDISAADLEVGAIAARRAKEKTSDRQRRMSLDYAPHVKPISAPNKGSTSPNLRGKRYPDVEKPGTFAGALSSIYRSGGDDEKDRYASVNKSDGEFFKMLADSAKSTYAGDYLSDMSDGEGATDGNRDRDNNNDTQSDGYSMDDDDFEHEEVDNTKNKQNNDAAIKSSIEEIKQRWLASSNISDVLIGSSAAIIESASVLIDNTESAYMTDNNNNNDQYNGLPVTNSDEEKGEDDDENDCDNVEAVAHGNSSNDDDKDSDEDEVNATFDAPGVQEVPPIPTDTQMFASDNSDSFMRKADASLTVQQDSDTQDYGPPAVSHPLTSFIDSIVLDRDSSDNGAAPTTAIDVDDSEHTIPSTADNDDYAVITAVIGTAGTDYDQLDITDLQQNDRSESVDDSDRNELKNSNALSHNNNVASSRISQSYSNAAASRYDDNADVSFPDGEELQASVSEKQYHGQSHGMNAIVESKRMPDPIIIIYNEAIGGLRHLNDDADAGHNAVASKSGTKTSRQVSTSQGKSASNASTVPTSRKVFNDTKAHKRIAASTLAKVNKKLHERSNTSSHGTNIPAATYTKRVVAGSEPNKIVKLEEGTARLAKQFEELEREMRSLKSDKEDIAKTLRNNLKRDNSMVKKGTVAAAANIKHVSHDNDDDTYTEDSAVIEWTKKSLDVAAVETLRRLSVRGASLDRLEADMKVQAESLHLRESLARVALLQGNGDHCSIIMPSVEMRSMRDREMELLAEIDTLKGTIFELRTSLDKVVNEIDRVPARFLDKQAHKSSKSVNTNCDTGADNTEMISVKKTEYDQLVADCASLESLVSGYQKENERLVSEHKMREALEASRKAAFYDQQEAMNKELNRLRNVVTGDTVTAAVVSRKSADVFRMELDTDATIRSLRERLAISEAEAGIERKELTLTIDKLRADYRQLVSDTTQTSKNVTSHHTSEQHALDDLKRSHLEEVQSLRSKLVWYAENQQLIEDTETCRREVQAVNSMLQKELIARTGMDAKTVNTLIDDTIKAYHANDTSSSSMAAAIAHNKPNTAAAGVKKSSRSPADIKKIKELEAALVELQESIMKRNPDSVASLIRAAKASDSVQIERKKQAECADNIKNELVDAKSQYDKKLRSLRQEHERIKSQYEKRIHDLEVGAPTVVATTASTTASKGKATNGAVKTLSQAQTKIKELEDEVEKVRTFYTRKVEEIQKKAEVQMRAYKRGEVSNDVNEVGNDSGNCNELNDKNIRKLELELSETVEEFTRVKQENKVIREELERCRRDAKSMNNMDNDNCTSIPSLIPPIPSTAISINQVDIEKEIQNRVATIIEYEKLQMNAAINQSDSKLTNDLLSEKSRMYEQMQSQSQLWSVEKDSLRSNIHSLELENQSLRMETSRLAVQLQRPHTPQMAQFLLLESQLASVENRLSRREKELMSAIDEGKVAAKIELTRMQSIHSQELREKDEQLIKFQNELEALVIALKHFEKANGTASTTSVIYA